MIKAPVLDDELMRLQSLRKLKILDSDPEERFDRITRLACKLLDVPIALVSLVDSHRQWFKSRQGLDINETPRDISFCGHAIEGADVMIVDDATNDDRFCDNPLVTSDPSIRFYAGYPLKGPDGHHVGTLCVIDRDPRDKEDVDVEALRELGEIVEQELVIESMVRDDPLTGLLNRSGFREIGQRMLHIVDRSMDSVSLLLVQLENHVAIESAFSPEKADRAVVELAQLIMTEARQSDLVARIDPATFAILMASSMQGAVQVVGNRIERRVNSRNTGGASEFEIEVDFYSADMGAEKNMTIDALLKSAENQMTGTDVFKALADKDTPSLAG